MICGTWSYNGHLVETAYKILFIADNTKITVIKVKRKQITRYNKLYMF